MGARGAQFLGRRITMSNHYGRRRNVPTISQVLPSPTVPLLPKDLCWTMVAELASCTGRHLTSSRRCTVVQYTGEDPASKFRGGGAISVIFGSQVLFTDSLL